MKVVTDNSLFELKSVAQATVLKDDIFFVETQMRQKENDYATTIKSVNAKTKIVKNWGDSGSINTGIELNPNKDYLSYLSNDNANKKMQLKVIPINGGSAVTLTCEEDGVSQYLWSKDSKSIYFMTTVSAETEKENEKKEENKNPKVTVIEKITYKVDGAGILPTNKKYVLKKVSLETKEVEIIHEFSDGIGLAYVSKNEDFIIFNQSDTVKDEFAFSKYRPYKLDIASKKIEPLVSEKGGYAFEAMNDDETFFIVSGNDFSYGFVTQSEFYVVNLKTLEMTNLTKNIDLELGDLLVADFQQQVFGVKTKFIDSETFVFSASEHGKVQFYTLTLSGKLKKLVDERVHLTSAEYIDSNKVVSTYSNLTTPSVVGEYHLETKTFNILYNPNEKFEQKTTIITPEMYYYKGYNNWDIQAWYLKPVHIKEKYPLVLYIHGGPQVAYGETFFHEMQSLAGKGYAVLMVNPRGGNSYGQKFVASILGDYGHHDFDDLMLAVDDILVKDKNIDTNNIFVTGGSYGGFMTNWIVGHTNRFTAAVTQRSISNWISFYGASDIGFAFVENQLQNDLSNVERLWEMSPLAYANKVETPLLILHGESDLRCPIEQAQQLYTVLKRRQVPTKLMTFPQSSHGLSRSGLPNLRLERLKAITDWFEQFKK